MGLKPYLKAKAVNLLDGNFSVSDSIVTIPANRLFMVEFVGINAFAQENQELSVALEVTTTSDGIPEMGIFPIVLGGKMAGSDPDYPLRLFGSQQVKLYADPDSDLKIVVTRNGSFSKARAMVHVSGLLIDIENGIPSTPTGLVVR
jgi:hypothetical protein